MLRSLPTSIRRVVVSSDRRRIIRTFTEPVSNPTPAGDEEVAREHSGVVVFVVNHRDQVGHMINPRRFLPTDYESEPIWWKLDQLKDCQPPLRNFYQSHVSELCKSFLTKRFDYA